MSPDVQPPIIERYRFTWIQRPDGLYHGPPYPGDDDTLVFLEGEGTLGHNSVSRGDYRYFLRYPDVEAPRSDRFGWADGDLGYYPVNPEAEDAP